MKSYWNFQILQSCCTSGWLSQHWDPKGRAFHHQRPRRSFPCCMHSPLSSRSLCDSEGQRSIPVYKFSSLISFLSAYYYSLCINRFPWASRLSVMYHLSRREEYSPAQCRLLCLPSLCAHRDWPGGWCSTWVLSHMRAVGSRPGHLLCHSRQSRAWSIYLDWQWTD